MQYIGEHLFPGQIGHFLVVLSFVTALLASFSFFFATQRRDTAQQKGWRNLGRYAYLLHGLATLCIIATLFWILTNKMYEYQYAWANISDDLPTRYVFSAFWKEQQGSFLLWSFWNLVLGIVLMFRAGKWETPVLTVIALAETFIASMLLGLYFSDFRLGASPFDLLRDAMNAPIFNQADYLAKIKGNGLNPLLQNYWMTIHPPTLFLGFASTIVPFGFAIAGLWLRDHKAWLKPALQWALFSGTILGTGILMGGAWAYEALSFAGYWAWDPVENTSLVPWLTLVAGIHTNLIARSTGYSIRSAYGFYLLTFILILYSTYLTRSGILGDTSVHSFTEMGLGLQLILFIGLFSILGFWLWFSRRKLETRVKMVKTLVKKPRTVLVETGNQIVKTSTKLITGKDGMEKLEDITELVPEMKEQTEEHEEWVHEKYENIKGDVTEIAGIREIYYEMVPMPELAEERSSSREFWMFIGSLVLLFSALLMTGATSLPVWNKIVQIFKPEYVGAALKDPMAHHNRYQLWIAVFIGLLTSVAQWMRYSERNWSGQARKFATHIGIALVAAAALTALNAQWINVRAWQLYTFLFAAMFTVSANADYLVSVMKGNLKLAGSAVSHMGFGILLLGILSTGLGKDWISVNTFAMDGLIEGSDEEMLQRNVILMKDAPMPIRGFTATYSKDTLERQTRSFTVNFQRRDDKGNLTGENFTLFPNVMYDRQFSKVVANNPSTQHYWNYDVFTLVSSLPKGELDPEFAKQQEDSLKFEKYEAVVGDTIFTKKHYIVVEGVTKSPQHPDYHAEKGDLSVGLKLRAYALDDPKSYPAAPMLYLRPGKGGFSLPANIGQLQMKLRLNEASMEQVFKAEDELKYTNFGVKEGSVFEFKGYQIQFDHVIKEVQHASYAPEPGDIAVAAGLKITAPDGRKAEAAPVYLIRNSQPFSIKDEAPSLGLHFRFENIDPKEGILTIGVAETPANQGGIPIEIAENAARSDYIVLEAIIFPGINLVWLGSIVMLFGIALSLWKRLTLER